MNIKELRLSKGLTQMGACNLIGLELRTYQNYESGRSKRDKFKIGQIIKTLESYNRITEEKGLLTLEEIRASVTKVCKGHKVSYVYLFGSYAKGNAGDSSDVDLLIDCEETGLSFVGLMEEFHSELHKNVDLIRTIDLTNNFDFLNEILKTGIKLYGKE